MSFKIPLLVTADDALAGFWQNRDDGILPVTPFDGDEANRLEPFQVPNFGARQDAERPGATVIGLGPSPAFASAMGAVIHDLNPAVQRGQVALGRARKPGDQARGANQVADAYGRAVSGLKRLPPNPAATGAAAALVGAFQAEQRAYSALARAAGHNDRQGYNTARGSITTAGRNVSAALGQLSHLGYVSS